MSSSKLFLSPHNDDEVLFGAFTIQREAPDVAVVFDSHLQPERGHGECRWDTRRRESNAGVRCLRDFEYVSPFEVFFLGLSDREAWTVGELVTIMSQKFVARKVEYSEVWAPGEETRGHEHHNLVAAAALLVFPNAKIHRYLTYTRTSGKSTHGIEVKPKGIEVRRKLEAMACYKTQLENDALGCWPHFMDLREFVLPE